jgi:DNA polymerase III delta subunit
MKYNDFVASQSVLPTLVIIEGTERLLAQNVLAMLADRVIADGDRSLNCERIDILEPGSLGRIEAAAAAFAFLAPARLVVVTNVHEIKTEDRRAFWKMAQTIRPGNVVVIEDLVPPTSKRPEPLSKSAGKNALVIDTTVTAAMRTQFALDTLREMNVIADELVPETLGHSERDLHSIREDLRKLALLGRKITVSDVLAECVNSTESKTFEFAGMLIEGRKRAALNLADELLSDNRSAAIPMLYSLATEYLTIWEMTRTGGVVPPKQRWRQKSLSAFANQIGERRAKLGIERAVKGFEAVVTGKVDDARTVIMLCIDVHPLTAKET